MPCPHLHQCPQVTRTKGAPPGACSSAPVFSTWTVGNSGLGSPLSQWSWMVVTRQDSRRQGPQPPVPAPPTSPHTHRRPGPPCPPPGSPAPAGHCGAHSGSGICPQGSAGHHPCTTCSQPQVQSGGSPAHAQDSLLTHPPVPSILTEPTLLDATHPKNRRSCVLVTAARAVFRTAARSHPLLGR